MNEIYRDKAGNRLVKELDGTYAAYNAEGKLVGKKGFETLAKRAGFQGLKEVKNKKISDAMKEKKLPFANIFDF